MLSVIPFAGFYDSMHDAELDGALEQMFQDNNGDPNEALVRRAFDLVDWQAAQLAYAEAYAENFCSEFKIAGKFGSMTSPKFYNFETDRIFIELELAEVRRILSETNQGGFYDMAKEMFTSRSGFISSYSPNPEDWGDVETWDHNQVYCLISAYAEQETQSSDGFDNWAQLNLMESDRGNGDLENMIYNDKMKRLCDISYYLRQRQERKWRVAA